MLEEESKALADRLVRGQVSRAEEEETTFVVQRELDALRHTHLETTHQLALANEKIRSLSLMMEETVKQNVVFYFYVIYILFYSTRRANRQWKKFLSNKSNCNNVKK